ncbi:hypothetical protein Q9L42_001950 [Methylomarinum sp. Ch1-1]|uniref:Uncharacterized protein n=1 Tax=Methylomarinum roseum TaxID=3067653 RepID=A0AAU7NV98_9GAMM|nr:hypothetical protein [Methylomarinum sp. Ch1-1]MDP4523059.1 hypothetical protein [Methylomarinum sp. Ch1-1]
MKRVLNKAGLRRSWMLVFLMVLLPISVEAEEDGRYHAIVLHEGGRTGQSGSFMPKVFIIDSKQGHMWTWEQKTKLQTPKGEFALGTVLTYQGQVRPGKQIGDMVDQAVGR